MWKSRRARLSAALTPLALIAVGVAARLGVWAYNYRGVSLFCGDSASYYGLAQHLSAATPDRPSGFPFFLRALLAINESPAFLLVVTGALGIGAQLLLWCALRRYIGRRLGAALSAIVFLHPVFLKMNSMVFMADTLACFLVALALALLLAGADSGPRAYARHALAFLVFGYLTIVKNAFLYVGGVACLVVMVTRARRDRLAVLLYAAAFGAIPAWYAVAFNQPRLGTYAIESFSGRSLLANLLPETTCADLRDAAPNPHTAQIIAQDCTDDRLRVGAASLLWHDDSVMNEIEAELLAHRSDRVAGNRRLGELALRLVIRHPAVLARAMWRNLRDQLRLSPRQQWTLDQSLNLDAGCSSLVRQYFHIEPEEYARRWHANAQRSRLVAVETADRLSRLYAQAVNVAALVAFLLTMSVAPWRCGERPLLPGLILLTLVYGISITAGSYYDARVYFALNLFVYVAAVVAWGRRDGDDRPQARRLH